ncbi:MAG: hypothetical protein ACPGQD_00060 [Planctomycetota bacterium]
MATVKDLQKRKRELLERYRSARLEEMLLVTRQKAVEEAERGYFPWKGAFRSKEEIEVLYRERRKWDRRFFLGTVVLTVVLVVVALAASFLVQVVSPKPSLTREALSEERAGRNAAPETPGNGEGAQD